MALHIDFDWAFDLGAWPGPTSPSVGELWVGPQGLLGRLELELGLVRRQESALERAVALSRTLGDGFWSASHEVDAIGTARRMLEDRDLLMSWGWRGEAASQRLGALWTATLEASAGLPDRVVSVIDGLARGRVEVERITCHDQRTSYPPIWRRLLHALESAGVSVEVREPIPAHARGDLAAARSSGFTPTGDGSLQLFRPHGVLAAADEIGALLAAASHHASTVLVGGDAVLDDALGRYGVPRFGANRPTPGSAALLRACVESAFQPMHVADLHALICSDPGPVPRTVAWGLCNVLAKLPGRGSQAWDRALTRGLDEIDDDGTRRSTEDRLRQLLLPIAGRFERVPYARLAVRFGALESWARGRGLDELAARAHQLVRLLAETRDVSRGELLRLCDELEAPTVAGALGQVGLHPVLAPGAMIEPARVVIWWGFARDRAPAPPRIRLTNAEREALGELAPDPGAIMAAEARRWRRPLDLATETLILVSPRTDAVGDVAQPHPLWDELVAAMTDPTMQSYLECAEPVIDRSVRAARSRAVARRRPMAFDEASAHASLALRAEESPSSLERLLGCSFAYVLGYGGKLRVRLSTVADPGPLLYGNIAHAVLARVFGSDLGGIAAPARAEALFDAELATMAEALLLPDYQAERAMLRRAIGASARLVEAIIAESGASVRGVELPLSGVVGPAMVVGRADMVLADPAHVLDFKWGTAAYREALRDGAAVPLAIYAALVGRDAGAAFVSLRDQRVLGTRRSSVPRAIEPGDYDVASMVTAVTAAITARVGELTEGRLFAPGAFSDPERTRVERGVLRLAPDCGHCDMGALCGRRGRA